MMWFLVVMFSDGRPAPSMSNKVYPSRIACLADAPGRVGALASVDLHGRYLCMRRHEPDAQLAREPKGEF